jgi:hypothetical protein
MLHSQNAVEAVSPCTTQIPLEEYTSSQVEDTFPSPTSAHTSPVSFQTPWSPIYSDSGSSPGTTARTTRPYSVAFSFTYTLRGDELNPQPGLESVENGQADLEVAPFGNLDKEIYIPRVEKEAVAKGNGWKANWRSGLLCRFRRTLFWWIGGALVVIVIFAMVIGLGLGLGVKDRYDLRFFIFFLQSTIC